MYTYFFLINCTNQIFNGYILAKPEAFIVNILQDKIGMLYNIIYYEDMRYYV